MAAWSTVYWCVRFSDDAIGDRKRAANKPVKVSRVIDARLCQRWLSLDKFRRWTPVPLSRCPQSVQRDFTVRYLGPTPATCREITHPRSTRTVHWSSTHPARRTPLLNLYCSISIISSNNDEAAVGMRGARTPITTHKETDVVFLLGYISAEKLHSCALGAWFCPTNRDSSTLYYMSLRVSLCCVIIHSIQWNTKLSCC